MAETVDITSVKIWPLLGTSRFGYVVGERPEDWKLVRIVPGRLTWVGRVASCSRGGHGYFGWRYTDDSGRVRGISRPVLVATHYWGPRPAGMEVCHGDGSRDNDTKENLRWDTRSGNHADKARHGTSGKGMLNGCYLHPESVRRGDDHWSKHLPDRLARGARNGAHTKPERRPRGEAHGCAKINQSIAALIRAEPYYRGVGKMLAARYGISQGVVSKIRLGHLWTGAAA